MTCNYRKYACMMVSNKLLFLIIQIKCYSLYQEHYLLRSVFCIFFMRHLKMSLESTSNNECISRKVFRKSMSRRVSLYLSALEMPRPYRRRISDSVVLTRCFFSGIHAVVLLWPSSCRPLTILLSITGRRANVYCRCDNIYWPACLVLTPRRKHLFTENPFLNTVTQE